MRIEEKKVLEGLQAGKNSDYQISVGFGLVYLIVVTPHYFQQPIQITPSWWWEVKLLSMKPLKPKDSP